MKRLQRWISGVVAAVVGVLLFGGVVSSAADADDGRRDPVAPARYVPDPHPKTIVKVTGDAANGFEIHYFDGSADFPPTDSEAYAECGEYDTKVRRTRCRTQVRTRYYALADMRATIRYYKALLREASKK